MEIAKKICFSLERKSEGVVDDESGDGEEDENKEDWLVQVWQSETGSWVQIWGDAYPDWAICDFHREAG